MFATKAYIDNWKSLLNSNISTCPYNMANFGPLTAEIDWRVWGTAANFNQFRILALLLHRRRSSEVNQTLHDVWPSPGLVQCIVYIHFWGLLLPNGIVRCKIHFVFESCVLLYYTFWSQMAILQSPTGIAFLIIIIIVIVNHHRIIVTLTFC